MTSHPRSPDGGPPSAEACAQVAADLRARLAETRLAWEAALLRSDAALADGDPAEIEAALTEQRAVLAQLEGRVAAALGTPAEAVGAAPDDRCVGPSHRERDASLAPRRRATTATDSRGGAQDRGRAPALSGALAGLALLAGLWSIGPAVTTTTSDAGVAAAGEVTAAETEAQAVVERRAAASDVVRRSPLVVADVAGPTRDLAPFSSSLPASATRAAPPVGPDDPDDTPPRIAAVPEPTTDVTAAPAEPEPAPPPEPDEPLGPAEELAPDLPGEDAEPPRGPEVSSRAPAILEELTDEVRRVLRESLASDPTVGLR